MKSKQKIVTLLISAILNSCGSEEIRSPHFDNIADSTKNPKKIEIMNDTNQINHIDELVTNASNSGNPDDLTKLWRAFLNIKQWHFITKHKDNIQEIRPFIGIIENQPWVYIFTDRQKAQQYCLNEQNTGFADSKGGVHIISMDTDKAINYVLGIHSKGVYGMRINEGNGWFSPIENLNAIIEHVNNTN